MTSANFSVPVALTAAPSRGEAQVGARRLQASETNGAAWYCGLGYRRWKEFDQVEGGGTGQDDAKLFADDRYVVGVLSDGVGQSFYGNIAAALCTESLLQFLWDRRVNPPSREELVDFLDSLTARLASQVTAFVIPSRIQAALRVGLEKKRQEGSQAVLGAFILDRLRDDGSVTAYQVGDVEVFIRAETASGEWRSAPGVPGEREAYQLAANPDGRVRSTGGKIDLAVGVATGVHSVAITSDGMMPAWGARLDGIGNSHRMIQQLEDRAANDDASYVFAISNRLGQADTGDFLGPAPQSPASRDLSDLVVQSRPRPPSATIPILAAVGVCVIVGLGLAFRPSGERRATDEVTHGSVVDRPHSSFQSGPVTAPPSPPKRPDPTPRSQNEKAAENDFLHKVHSLIKGKLLVLAVGPKKPVLLSPGKWEGLGKLNMEPPELGRIVKKDNRVELHLTPRKPGKGIVKITHDGKLITQMRYQVKGNDQIKGND